MKIAGNLAARTLDLITDNIKPGITTAHIDKLGYEFIRDNGAYSAPLFYRGFKKSLCTSLNHVVCHGIPSDRVLNEGDALNVDVTAIIDKHYGDTSRMFCIGKTPVKVNNLIVFSNPTLYSKPLVILNEGRLCLIVKCQSGWCKIKVDKYIGWVKKTSLRGRF